MRSFEFVEGSSAKFWEISRAGAAVTVRFGRVGARGQTSDKAFADEAAAAAHETKLINEKLRKGYVETTVSPTPASAVASPVVALSEPAAPTAAVPGPAAVTAAVSEPAAAISAVSGSAAVTSAGSGSAVLPSAVSEPVDEDVFVLPPAWARSRTPRRSSAGISGFTPNPKARAAVEAELRRAAGRAEAVLAAPTTEARTRKEGRAWLNGEPTATPLGAAAVAVTTGVGRWQAGEWANCFADLWIRERGLAFAAEAAVTTMALIVVDDHRRGRSGRHQQGVRHRQPGEGRVGYPCDAMRILLRVRQALAASSEPAYAQVVEALRPHLDAGSYARAAVAALLPERREWFEQARADAIAAGDPYLGTLLLMAAATPDDVAALTPIADRRGITDTMNLLVTMIDGVGAAAAPLLFGWFDDPDNDADEQRRLLSALAVLPGDAATQGLIERIGHRYVRPALLENTERYPARALRLLAGSAGRLPVTDVLRSHVLKHRHLAEQVVPRLGADAAGRVEQILAESAAVAAAPLSAVPPVLADPPWRHAAPPEQPIVVTGLTCDDPLSVTWLPGEREQWAAVPFERHPRDAKWDLEVLRQAILDDQVTARDAVLFLMDAAEEVARPTLLAWRPRNPWMAGTHMRLVTARFGGDALPALLSLAPQSPADVAPVLLPLSSPAIAVLMARWLATKSVAGAALAWLLRHPHEAARALIPAALGKPGPARKQAGNALVALHTNGHTETVRSAARGYGEAAAAGVEPLLVADPTGRYPATIPAVPVWAVPGVLRPVVLRDGSGALPDEATNNLIVLLAMSPPGAPSPDLAAVREACEPSSLAAFGWSLFELWQASGAAWKENWALGALAHLGDDDTVRRLSPLILAWPGEGGHPRAVIGLQVLAAIGTDVALMHLHGIAQRSKFTGLKNAAREKMGEVAAVLGLTAEQLADRLVPDFGLDADGSLRLDYGPRQFVVGFDEQLRPFAAEPGGKRLKALPKPGVRDDATLAPAAYQRFTALKKDVRTVAGDQVRRLEQAMVTNRRWTGAEFRALFLQHPLVWHIARRLVWARFDAAEARPGAAPVAAGAFRVAEDRTFATVQDEETTVPDDAVVGVAHPLHLGDDLTSWTRVFADYEILQPFDQLGRSTFALTGEEASISRLVRFQGAKVPTARLLGLERRGWRREAPRDAGHQGRIELVIEPGREVVIGFDPGFSIGYIDMDEQQELTDVFLHDGTASRWWRADTEGQVAIGTLDPVVVSELLRDLTGLTGS